MKLGPEDKIQLAILEYLEVVLPGAVITHIPNGGKRNPREAMRLVVEGVSSGVPDLFVPEWLLWVEMKTKIGIVSKQQKDWIDYLNGIPGHTAIVARSMDIPAVVGARTCSQLVRQDDWVIIDGDAGVIIVDPTPIDRKSVV